MPRYKLIIEYDGSPFVGWQRQKNGPSVQQALEHALRRLVGETVVVFSAGRTDAGVHALGMVVHFDLNKEFTPDKLAASVNHFLKPLPVAVLDASLVASDFHARFSCLRRHYVYRLSARRAPLTLDLGRVWQRPYSLDVAAMDEAAQILVGRHDFTTFRATACQAASPVKTLEMITVYEHAGEVQVRCFAPSFLHNQIRSFVGTLERVGSGRWPVARVWTALTAVDRVACGPVAPPYGLYFSQADYP